MTYSLKVAVLLLFANSELALGTQHDLARFPESGQAPSLSHPAMPTRHFGALLLEQSAVHATVDAVSSSKWSGPHFAPGAAEQFKKRGIGVMTSSTAVWGKWPHGHSILAQPGGTRGRWGGRPQGSR